MIPFCIYFVPMNMIIITPEKSHPDEVELVRSFFANGLFKLHLRKPYLSAAGYRDFLNQIDQKFHCQISIHGNFELLKEFPGLGIHFNSHQRESVNLFQTLKELKPSACSTSFHTWKEIEENEYPFDYVFISPVFDSISKKGYKAAIDLSGALEIKQAFTSRKKKHPAIYALGGIHAGNIGLLNEYGFDGAAVLGAIWESADPLASFLQMKSALHG